MESIDDAVAKLTLAKQDKLSFDAAKNILEEIGACRMDNLRKALHNNQTGDISVDFLDK